MAHQIIIDFAGDVECLKAAVLVSQPWEGPGAPSLPTQAQQACLDYVETIAENLGFQFETADISNWCRDLEALNATATG